MTSEPNDRWQAGEAYEAYMGRWSRMVAGAFVRWLQPPPSADWLEVGCGTGALTSTICAHCEPARVVACDPSGPFIDHARRQVQDSRASFHVAGVDNLPPLEGAFDVAVSGLALNFMPNPDTAVAILRDCVKPGGTVAMYVWDYDEGMEFLKRFWEEAAALDPAAAALDEGRRFPICREAPLASLFRAAGLADVETRALDVPTTFRAFDDYWAPFLSGTGPAPSYVVSLSDENRKALVQRLRQRLPTDVDGSIRLRARAWAARGTVTAHRTRHQERLEA